MATKIEVFQPVLRELKDALRCYSPPDARCAGLARPYRQDRSGAGNDDARWLRRRAAATVR